MILMKSQMVGHELDGALGNGLSMMFFMCVFLVLFAVCIGYGIVCQAVDLARLRNLPSSGFSQGCVWCSHR